METSVSRMKNFWNAVFRDENGKLKQGQEHHTLYNVYGQTEIGLILRWQNGMLHDDGNLPAVEFQDAHIEHYQNGLLHNNAVDKIGKRRPAIISGYGSINEYYLKGKKENVHDQ